MSCFQHHKNAREAPSAILQPTHDLFWPTAFTPQTSCPDEPTFCVQLESPTALKRNLERLHSDLPGGAEQVPANCFAHRLHKCARTPGQQHRPGVPELYQDIQAGPQDCQLPRSISALPPSLCVAVHFGDEGRQGPRLHHVCGRHQQGRPGLPGATGCARRGQSDD